MDQKKKLALIISIALLILIISGVVLSFRGQKKLPSPSVPAEEREIEIELTPPAETTPPPGGEIPTLSPERKAIISKVETHVIVIQNKSFSPQNLTIKLHDQVEWQNKDNETYKIKGEGWGNVPIGPEESFTKAFETAGTYPYSCALHPDLTGTIVVTE